MKIYVRLADYGYAGQYVHFATLDRDRAFTVTEADEEAHLFDMDQKLYVYQDGELIDAYEWGGIGGWLHAPQEVNKNVF